MIAAFQRSSIVKKYKRFRLFLVGCAGGFDFLPISQSPVANGRRRSRTIANLMAIVQRGGNSAQPLADRFSTRTGAVIAYSVLGDAPKIQPISALLSGRPVAMASSAALSR
jgi:hypothetical protein